MAHLVPGGEFTTQKWSHPRTLLPRVCRGADGTAVSQVSKHSATL